MGLERAAGMSDVPATEPATPPAKAKARPSPILVVLMMLNLGASGFIGFRILTAEPAAAASAVHAPVKPTPEVVSGPVVAMEPFVVNLNEAGQPRYLKIGIEIELADAASVHALDKARQIVRDRLLGYLSNLVLADTLGEDAKTKIRTDLSARVEAVVGAGRLKRMFFSEFVVQ